MKEFFIDNRDTLLSLLWWVIAFLRWVRQFYKKNKHEIEIEKLKAQIDLEKSQKLLNDEKFRKWYEDFISLMFDMTLENRKDKPTEVEKKMADFTKTSLLFAWPETIKSFWMYRKEAWSGETKDVLLYMDELIAKMRKDLWVGNDWLEVGDMLQTFVVGDVKKELWIK